MKTTRTSQVPGTFEARSRSKGRRQATSSEGKPGQGGARPHEKVAKSAPQTPSGRSCSNNAKLAQRGRVKREAPEKRQTGRPKPRRTQAGSRLLQHLVPTDVHLPVSDAKGEKMQARLGQLIRDDREAPEFEVTRTDRFRHTTYWSVAGADLHRFPKDAGFQGGLPWRYRTGENHIALRQHPTPRSLPANLFGAWLAPDLVERLKDGYMQRFGGRCQSCGALNLNSRGRQVAPELLTTWEHIPHMNSTRRVGMRILKGVGAVCSQCMESATLVERRHSTHGAAPGSAQEIALSIIAEATSALPKEAARAIEGSQISITPEQAQENALLWLATHNRWPIDQERFSRMERWLAKAIESASSLDQFTWYSDLTWLYRVGLLKSGELVPLHFRQQARLNQPQAGILVQK